MYEPKSSYEIAAILRTVADKLQALPEFQARLSSLPIWFDTKPEFLAAIQAAGSGVGDPDGYFFTYTPDVLQMPTMKVEFTASKETVGKKIQEERWEFNL